MKLVIIEDQTLIRELLVMTCRQTYPDATIHAADTVGEGLALCRLHLPDLVLLDVVLPDGDGLELAPALRTLSPEIKLLALSSHTDEYTLHRAFAAGVNGFVDKNLQTLDLLHEAMRNVLAGEFYASASVHQARARMRADAKSFDKILSEREMELLGHLGYGKTNEEIATQLGLSPRTVRNHRHNIMAKLDLKSTPQLIRYAIEKGFTRRQLAS
ncbi:MAG: response regulator transcription factor [Opitutaceae bacterium]|jgi:two-component system response regulator NreC|nr:response regulator transcription factor [Opitutaceae bacterium]